jgi:hypothetical protein
MGVDERNYGPGRLGMFVAEHEVARWGDDFLAAVAAAGPEPEPESDSALRECGTGR